MPGYDPETLTVIRPALESLGSRFTRSPSGSVVIRLKLSDGTYYEFDGKPARLAKGIPSGTFKPKLGSIPSGTVPAAPVKTPAKETSVRMGFGLGIAGLSLAMKSAGLAIQEFLDANPDLKPKQREHTDLAAAIQAAAQQALAPVRTSVATKVITRRNASPPRTKIHAFSRRTHV